MKRVKQDIELNDGTYLIMNTLSIMYNHYSSTLPQDVKEIIQECLNRLNELHNQKFMSDSDIKDVRLLEQIIYK
jgi:hypothetical protein